MNFHIIILFFQSLQAWHIPHTKYILDHIYNIHAHNTSDYI